MKKILILVNDISGVYHFKKEVIEALIAKGNSVYLSTHIDEQSYVEKFKKMGTKIIETAIDRRGTNPLKDVKLFLYYLKIISEVKPDLILGYTIKPNIYGSLAAQILRVDYINTITGLGAAFQTNNFLSRILKLLYKISFRKSKYIFFQNEGNMNFFLKNKIIMGKKVKLIPGSGVNLEEFHPLPKSIKTPYTTFLFIGRIMKDKGIGEYLEAAKLIVEDKYNVKFLILGPMEESYWTDKIKKYEQLGYIKYLGASSDVREQIKNVDCIINPSYHEGMSNVLLEAGAMEKVLLGSNIPGIKEIIEPLGKDYLFEKQNIDDLQNKIKRTLTIKDLKKEGRKFREKISEKFDRKNIINAYIKVIHHE